MSAAKKRPPGRLKPCESGTPEGRRTAPGPYPVQWHPDRPEPRRAGIRGRWPACAGAGGCSAPVQAVEELLGATRTRARRQCRHDRELRTHG